MTLPNHGWNDAATNLNAALWEQLCAEPDRWHDPAEVANRLGCRGSTLPDDVAALEAFGYGIEWHPLHGLRCLHPAERLCPDQIEWKLNTQAIGRKLSVWNRVESTQSVAAAAAHCSANHGLAVLAEEQSAGRGRRGRTWVAPPRSSILLSVLVFPPQGKTDRKSVFAGDRTVLPRKDSRPLFPWLTAWAAVAVGQLAEEVCGQTVRIKQPNDVLIDGRKVAGILVEQFGSAYAVGIGLNVNLTEHDFTPELRATAASLAQFTGTPLDRSEVAHRLLQRLDALYLTACRDGTNFLWQWWQQRSAEAG